MSCHAMPCRHVDIQEAARLRAMHPCGTPKLYWSPSFCSLYESPPRPPMVFVFAVGLLFVGFVFQICLRFSYIFASCSALWRPESDSPRCAVQVGPTPSSIRQLEAMVLLFGWDFYSLGAFPKHCSIFSDMFVSLSALWRSESDSPRRTAHKHCVVGSILHTWTKIPHKK